MPRVLNRRTDSIPPGAVYVGRPSKWGSPFKVKKIKGEPLFITHQRSVAQFREYLSEHPELVEAAKVELCRKDLVCWCAPLPCHADVWMEVLMPSNWKDLPPDDRDRALAEKLGWKYEKLGRVWGWRLPDDRWYSAVWHSPTTSWAGMGLVVAAMAAKGFDRIVTANNGAPIHVAFIHDRAFGSATSDSEPEVTAEAAWKALGGE